MDDFHTLAKLVREARIEDKRTLDIMTQATADWKAANALLTDRIKVLDGYLNDQKNRATAL